MLRLLLRMNVLCPILSFRAVLISLGVATFSLFCWPAHGYHSCWAWGHVGYSNWANAITLVLDVLFLAVYIAGWITVNTWRAVSSTENRERTIPRLVVLLGIVVLHISCCCIRHFNRADDVVLRRVGRPRIVGGRNCRLHTSLNGKTSSF